MKHPTFQASTRYVHVIHLYDTKEQGFFTSFLLPQKLLSINSRYGCRCKGKKQEEISHLVYRFPICSTWSISKLKSFSFLSLGCQVAEDKHSVCNFTELPHVLPWSWETHPHGSYDRQEKLCATGENLFHSLFASLCGIWVERIPHSCQLTITTHTAVYSLVGCFFKHPVNFNQFWPLQTLL